MPLDGHSFLVAQGWSGKGTGLRQGAITRPITVSQKKTLSGIGKDRDEAFPFWDHLFSAAAKSIQVKITSSDEEDDSDEDTPSAPTLKRTTTGILSNKRPIDGIPATPDPSGSSTPISSTVPTQRLSLLSMAKREAAKRGLYSKFFRGPVLGPDPSFALPSPSPTPAPSIEKSTPTSSSVDKSTPKMSDKGKGKTKEEKALKRQRRAEKAERKERKRLKLEARTAESEKVTEKCKDKAKAKEETRSAEKASTADAKKRKRHRKVEITDEAIDEPPRKKKRKRDHTDSPQ